MKVKFYPDYKERKKRFWKRTLHWFWWGVAINIVLIAIHLLWVFTPELIPLFQKVKVDLQSDTRTVKKDVARADSLVFDCNHVPYLFAGHSYLKDSIKDMMDLQAHCNYVLSLNTDTTDTSSLDGILGFYGIDVSRWQNSIDWSQVLADSIPQRLKFFILKATQGETEVDPYYTYNRKNARSANTIIGAYHFFMYHDDPLKQAQNFIQHAGLKSGDLRPIIDVELNCAGCDELDIPEEQLVANLQTFIDTLHAFYGVKPILYTYSAFYEKYLKGQFDDYMYWWADFSSVPPYGMSLANDSIQKQNPLISIWQFTNNERIKGIVGDVDVNYLPSHYLDLVLYQ